MVVNFDTGFPWLDTFLTVVLMILFTYPILGGFAWFIGVICNRFLFRYRQLEWIPIPEEIEPMITITAAAFGSVPSERRKKPKNLNEFTFPGQ